MAAPKLMYGAGNAGSTTTSSSMTNSDTATPLTSTTNFSAAPTPGEGMILLDEGASTEELAYGTGLSGASVTTPLVNRGLEGGSAQAHSAGASVKGVLTVGMWNNMITALLNVLVQSSGALDTTKVPGVSGGFATTLTTTAATNVTLPTTGTLATLAGSETLTNKVLTKPTINGSVSAYTSDTDGATVTFDMSASNVHTVTLGGNRTLAVSNVSVGQPFILRLVQDATGSRTVTWFTTIKWAGGSAPTLTTTASKADTFGFICTSSGNYDGYIVGQNL